MQIYKCKNCDAPLFWNAKTNSLHCEFCGETYQTTDFEDVTVNEEHVPQEIIADQEPVQNEDTVSYVCQNCQGTVVATKTTMATTCPYCGEAISITSKSTGDFRPSMIIPFALTKQQAQKIYSDQLKKSKLIPQIFLDNNTIEKIQGVYVPFYLHTLTDRANHTFRGEKVSHSRRGDDRITTHHIYHLHIDADYNFEKVPTDASKKLSNKLMDAIEPFVYGQLQDYNPAFMAGFLAEQKDDDPQLLKDRVLSRCKESAEAMAKDRFSGYSSIVTVDRAHDIQEYNTDYVMLPVWVLNVKHEQTKYQFLINGQTGKFAGELPLDKKKLLGYAAAFFGVVEGIGILLSPIIGPLVTIMLGG